MIGPAGPDRSKSIEIAEKSRKQGVDSSNADPQRMYHEGIAKRSGMKRIGLSGFLLIGGLASLLFGMIFLSG